MKTYREDELVECPFYLKDGTTAIKCEGICGMSTMNIFRSRSCKEDYKDNFCRGLYTSCALYLALDEGYDTRDIQVR